MLGPDIYYNFGGEPIEEGLLAEPILGLLRACQTNPSCDVVELKQEANSGIQCIVADFAEGTFDVSNAIGIHRVERMALSYCGNAKFPWEVTALRKDFPYTSEQNHAPLGEPRALCLYLASWESVQRSWTPQLFLKQILWWLRATADGTIHSKDQPLERLFFASAYLVVLPKGYFEGATSHSMRSLIFRDITNVTTGSHTLIGKYREESDKQESYCFSLPLLLDSVEYGPIEGISDNFGQLSEILVSRNSDLLGPLKAAIAEQVGSEGVKANKNGVTLLVLGIPRTLNGEGCGFELQGFIAYIDFCELGEQLGVLHRMPEEDIYYRNYPQIDAAGGWKEILIDPVNVSSYPNEKAVRNYSGLSPEDEGPVGIIAGVGALGGLVAQIWNTECWGDWHYVDSDIIQAHNIVRHIATYHSVGYAKSHVVSDIVHNIHQGPANTPSRGVQANIESDDQVVKDLVNKASLLVDVTTTTHVPRIISRSSKFPRTVSLFLTPSGLSSVLLLEDEERCIRCNSLEAQYYRAVLNSEWGKNHLGGHSGALWVGGGCREVTLPLANEILHLHAGNLARQVRTHIKSANPKICIWEYQDEGGSTLFHNVPVFLSSSFVIGDWEVFLDDGILSYANKLRAEMLPTETGGVLLGIVDQHDKTITLVKVCSSPSNSEGSETEFTRAAYESDEFMKNCLERTAGIVTYVGEWHSHPKGTAPVPSQSDFNQHAFVHATLIQEGRPALMMIVSENAVGLYFGAEGAVISTNKVKSSLP